MSGPDRDSRHYDFGGPAGRLAGNLRPVAVATALPVELLKLERIYWTRQGLNLRPPPCHGGALPAELRAQSILSTENIL